MKQFLRENLFWILAPIVVVGLVVVVAAVGLALFGGGGGDEAPFVYSLF